MHQYSAPLTAAQAEQLGNDVGLIVAFAARALNQKHPHLSLNGLVETFTRPLVLESTSLRYLAALEDGATASEAAGKAVSALIRMWADARLRAAEATATT